MTLSSDVLAYALALGFDRTAILPAGPPRYGAQFAAWLAAGYHGEMAYLAARTAERLDPARLAPDAASMIVTVVSYDLPAPGDMAAQPGGRIARYARWPDYHETIKARLHALDAFIRERTGRATLGKAFVDSAPVLERDFAEQAGLGFIGRNTCLITPGLGSWTFLAGLSVPEGLDCLRSRRGSWKLEAGNASRGMEGGCGRCTRCLDACPTRAFVGPHVLDARRCISYLTIELRGPIPRDLRPLMGDWVFGCDVCQEVCPYNRGSRATSVGMEASAGLLHNPPDRPTLKGAVAQPRCQGYEGSSPEEPGMGSPVLPSVLSLADLLTLDEASFRARFRGTPVLRAKHRGLVRNACVAAGNSGDAALVPALIALLADPEPLARGHAAWALRRIGGRAAEHALAQASAVEADPWVREEMIISGG